METTNIKGNMATIIHDKDTYVYESCFRKAGFKKGHDKYSESSKYFLKHSRRSVKVE